MPKLEARNVASRYDTRGHTDGPPRLIIRLSPAFVPRHAALGHAWQHHDLPTLARLARAPELLETLGRLGNPPARPVLDLALEELFAAEYAAEDSESPPLHSLSQYWRLDLSAHRKQIPAALAALRATDGVELAWQEPVHGSPGDSWDNDPRLNAQPWVADAPMGVSAEYAWSHGIFGGGVGFVDLERGWHRTGHKDLPSSIKPDAGDASLIWGVNTADRSVYDCTSSSLHTGVSTETGEHGILSLGVVLSQDNKIGCVGVAPKATALGVVSYVNGTVGPYSLDTTWADLPTAIFKACNAMSRGDVLLLEVQVRVRLNGGGCAPWPAEILDDVMQSIRLATARGIIVVEAAGNGPVNLDDADLLGLADPATTDSGAIVVASCLWHDDLAQHRRQAESNFGARINCFAAGKYVMSTGADIKATTAAWSNYRNHSGTSAASAIIAGVAVLVQSRYKAVHGSPLSPSAMRAALSDAATGTRAWRYMGLTYMMDTTVGVMPNLAGVLGPAGLDLVTDALV